MKRILYVFILLVISIFILPNISFGQRTRPGISLTPTLTPTSFTTPTKVPNITADPRKRNNPYCDSGGQFGPCNVTTPNSCVGGNGTQTVTYTSSSTGAACVQVSKSQACTLDTCLNGYACRSGTCINLTPTLPPYNGGNMYSCQNSACVNVGAGNGLYAGPSCDSQSCSGHQVFGYVYQDKNGNGKFDPGEGINGVSLKFKFTYTDGNNYTNIVKTADFRGGFGLWDGFYGIALRSDASNINISIDDTTLPSGFSLLSPVSTDITDTSNDVMVSWQVTTSGAIATPTSTTNNTPTPESNLTSTPTPSGPTPTPTPLVTPSPGDTVFNIKVGLDAIGSTGDNQNPNVSTGSNKNPITPTRNLIIEVYDSNNQLVVSKPGTMTYDSASGKFLSIFDIGNTPFNGNYTIKAKSNGYLKKLFPGIISLSSTSSGVTNVDLPLVNLVAGDINTDNSLTISDYAILASCSIYSTDNQSFCNTSSVSKTLSDLNDDGAVDQIDYNLFLREYSVQNGD